MMFVEKLRGKIDFSGYNADFGVLRDPIAKEFNELVEAVLADEESGGIRVHLPGLYDRGDGLGGACADDPLTIYIELPFSEEGLFSVSTVLHSFALEDLFNHEVIDDEWSEEGGLAAERFSAALRALADQVDAKAAEWERTNRWPD